MLAISSTMTTAQPRLTIALDVLSEIDRITVAPALVDLLDRAEVALTLATENMSGEERDPEHQEYAKSIGVGLD
jgi:hypothetical protein